MTMQDDENISRKRFTRRFLKQYASDATELPADQSIGEIGLSGGYGLSRRDFLKMAGTGFAGAAILGLAGCGTAVGGGDGGNGQTSAKYLVETKDGPYTVGLSNSFIENSWRVQMVAEIEHAIEQNDQVEDFVVANANNDASTQNSQIGDLVSKGIDILLVNSVSTTALDGAIQRAHDQGVLVVAFDNVVTSPSAIVVSHDQVQMAQVGAKWLTDQLGGKGEVFGLSGISGAPVSDDRWEAAKKVLENSGIEVVGEVNADWDQAKARAATADLISAHPNANGIYSQSGNMALGALQALAAAGRAPLPVPGEGYNGFLKKWEELNKSYGFTSVAPAIAPELGVEALDIALKAIKGEDVGRKPKLELPVIDQENLDEFVRPEYPDSLWLPTRLPDNKLNELFG